jgi:hypothetical protein
LHDDIYQYARGVSCLGHALHGLVATLILDDTEYAYAIARRIGIIQRYHIYSENGLKLG